MTELRITLSIPDRVLSPNARAHWAVKARATRETRGAAYYRAMAAMREQGMKPPMWETAEAHVTFYWPTAHRRDRDNAQRRMKPVWDGLQDAGVVEDDAGFIHYPPTMSKDADNPRVEVTVEAITSTEEAA